ncbi:VWA domain-containing protein [Metabacillus sp. 113a]|uniref:VWA domain-containing protein n=1 Tax=Metabacillus sp. 113a TaxID=3404706 RepID=UPI003CF08921
MFKRIFAAILLMTLMISTFYLPSASASVPTGMYIETSVSASPETMNIGYGESVSSSLEMKILAKGEAPKTERPPIDVVFVFDKSGSMNDTVNGKTKLQHAKEAMDAALSTFNENNKNRMVSDRFALVAFDSGVSDANSQFSLTSNTSGISSKISAMRAEGGTNYTNSLEKARQILEQGKDSADRKQYIIFMTDGKPTNSEKITAANRNFKELIEVDDYSSRFGNRSFWIKYFSGMVTTFKDGTYVIGDSGNRNVYITGTKKQYFDSNPSQNYVIAEHGGKYYIELKSASAVQSDIEGHIHEQAQLIADQGISLQSIGFGEARNASQIDMDFLNDLSLKGKGQAINAVGSSIVEVFQTISRNISSAVPVLTGGYIKFNLPEGASLDPDSKARRLSGGKYQIDLDTRIEYDRTPIPEQVNYTLPITFSQPGSYSIDLEMGFNGGEYKKTNKAVLNVKPIPVSSAAFDPITIEVGETVTLNPLLRIEPANAFQKLDKIKKANASNQAFSISVENGIFTATGLSPGFDDITAEILSGDNVFRPKGKIYVKDPDSLKW